jgi:D-glycero-alpha-D-manno-heptose-7-phosphate kinase
MFIEAKTPVRVDLAGGTIDLWPIYLLIPHSQTLPLAVSIYARTRITVDTNAPKEKGGQILCRSEDQGKEVSYPYESLLDPAQLKLQTPELILHELFFSQFSREIYDRFKADGIDPQKVHITISTSSGSPAGAGLGGSSTLGISLLGAAWTLAGGSTNENLPRLGDDFINIAKDLESRVLYGPAGMQDYMGAMFGGLQCLKWRPGGWDRKNFEFETAKKLSDRMLLFYSGQSRNSGLNNWALYKGLIDHQPGIAEKFRAIALSAVALEKALDEENFQKAIDAIASEWETRRTLAAGISTPKIDQALERARAVTSNLAFKICGAGGGGCFFILLPTDDKATREKVKAAVLEEGFRELPFEASKRGLQITVTEQPFE